MGLTFIYGKAGRGKSTYCIDEMNKLIEKGEERKIIYLVPEQYSFMAQKNIIKKILDEKSNRVLIWDFKKMSRDILKSIGKLNRDYIDNVGRNMLIYNILKENKESFKTFSIASSKKGFTSIISSLISEFKRFNVSPENIYEAIEKVDELELKEKLLDIYLIYNKLNLEINEKFIDEEDNLSYIALAEGALSIFKNSIVYIDEFKSFTPSQYSVLERIIKESYKVSVTLNYDSSNKEYIIFDDIKKTEEKIIKILEINNVSLEEPVVLLEEGRFKGNAQLSFLEEEFFSYPNRLYQRDVSNISLFRSLNPYGEISNICDEIIRLVRDEKIRYKDIAVVTRDINLYENTITSIFKEYEIPYFLDSKKEIKGNVIIILLSAIENIWKKNFDYESIFLLLKTGLMDVSYEEIYLIENYILASGIRGSKKWREDFKYKVDTITDKLEEINSIREKVIKPIDNLFNKVKGENTVIDISKYLYSFMEEINLYGKVNDLIEELNKENFISYSLEYKQIYNIVINTLDTLVNVMGNKKITFENYMNILLSSLEEKKIGIIPATIDEVLISSCDRIRSSGIKHLFIVGVNEGVFPMKGNEEGILKDKDREVLKDLSIEIAKLSRDMVYEEQYLIYKTLTIVSQKLYLSYATSDNEGKALRPSFIINRIKKLYPNIKEESDLFKRGDEIIISSKLPTFNRLLLNIRKEENEEIGGILNFFIENEEYRERAKRIISTLNYGVELEHIGEISDKLYGDLTFSASRIETYSKCPFSYFAKYGLKIQERKEYSLSPIDTGSFLHYILENFSKSILDKGISWRDISKEFIKDSVENLVEIYINNLNGNIFSSSNRYIFFKERLIRLSIKTIDMISMGLKESSFTPLYYEKDFNQNSSFPPLTLKLNCGRDVFIIGKIDRVDIYEKEGITYVRIIDYKSGTRDFSLSELYYGSQIQLLLYLHVALKGAGENTCPSGMLYFKLDDPIIKSDSNISDEKIEEEIKMSFRMKGLLLEDIDIIKDMDNNISGNSYTIPAKLNVNGTLANSSSTIKEKDLNELMCYLEKLIKISCDRMLQGDIMANPLNNGTTVACDYCPYSTLCQFDPSVQGCNYRWIKKMSDEEVLLKIKEEGENNG